MIESTPMILSIPSMPFDENTYITYFQNRQDCLVFDPGTEPHKIFAALDERHLTPAAIVCTHGHADHIAGSVLLSTKGGFAVANLTGDGADGFACIPGAFGAATECTFSMYWDGSLNGFERERVDAFAIGSGHTVPASDCGYAARRIARRGELATAPLPPAHRPEGPCLSWKTRGRYAGFQLARDRRPTARRH